MQTNKITNVILGIIAIALIVIIILFVTNKNTQPADSSMATMQTYPTVPLNNYPPAAAPTAVPVQNSSVQTAPQTQPSTPTAPSAAPAVQAYAPTSISSSTISNSDNYQSVVQSAQSQPANFDGHYEFLFGRCGNGCQAIYLFDKSSGQLYSLPDAVLNGVVGGNQDNPTAPTNYSVSGNIFTITKVNSAGVNYTEKWELTSSGFVKVS